jgi:hypothetical protein
MAPSPMSLALLLLPTAFLPSPLFLKAKPCTREGNWLPLLLGRFFYWWQFSQIGS